MSLYGARRTPCSERRYSTDAQTSAFGQRLLRVFSPPPVFPKEVAEGALGRHRRCYLCGECVGSGCAALVYDDRMHVPLKSGFVAVSEGYSVKLKVFRFVRTHV